MTEIRDALQAAYEQACTKEEECARAVADAKAQHQAARAEKKKLARVVREFEGTAPGGPTKDTVRPLVTQVLRAAGRPLSRKQTVEKVKPLLVEAGISGAGLLLVIRALATEFENASGLWSLDERRQGDGKATFNEA